MASSTTVTVMQPESTPTASLPAAIITPAVAAAVATTHALHAHEHDDHDSVEELRTCKDHAASATEAGGEDASGVPRDDLFRNDVQLAFAALPEVKPSWTHKYFKMLVVGESGMGKTTFVRNMFAPLAQNAHFPVADAGVFTGLEAFASNPEKLCTEVVVRDEDNRVLYHYLIQETPGYGDTKTPITEVQRLVCEYVTGQHRRYLETERSAGRSCGMHELPDGRVDVALFFISPHHLKQCEVDFMVALSSICPVVPLLAKADTMTADELHEYKQHVRSVLTSAGKHVMHSFSTAALDEAGVRRGCPPFAVVGSSKMDLSVGSFWPVRVYPWGRCEALSSRHSDASAVRRLLLEVAYEEIKGCTDERYYAYRRRHGYTDDEEDNNNNNRRRHHNMRRFIITRLVLLGGVALALATGLPAVIGDIVREKKGDLVLALEGAQQQVTALKQNVEDSVTQAAQGVKDKGREAKRSVATGVVKLLDEEEVLAPPEPKHKRFWFF